MSKGKIHIYTGNGKGKTTAAIGLAVRAAGAGKRVFIGQFVKGMHYNELNALKLIPNITIRQYGLDCFIINQPTDKDIAAALKGLEEIKTITTSKEYDVVILDELCIALYYKLFDEEEIIKLIRSKPESIEMIITGRYASERLISEADLVTEMKEIKHYYNNGQSARKGIEY